MKVFGYSNVSKTSQVIQNHGKSQNPRNAQLNLFKSVGVINDPMVDKGGSMVDNKHQVVKSEHKVNLEHPVVNT